MPERKLNIHVGIVSYNLPQETQELIQSCVSLSGHDVTVQLFNHSPYPEVWEVASLAAKGKIAGTDGKPVRCVVHDHKKNRGLCVGWNEAMLCAYAMNLAPIGAEWLRNDTVVHPGTFDWDDLTERVRNCADDTDTVLILVNDDVLFDAAEEPTEASQFTNTWDAEARLGWPGDDKSDIDRIAEYAVSRRDLFAVTILGYNQHYERNPDPVTKPWIGQGYSCFAVNPVALRTIGLFDENLIPCYFEDCDWGRRANLAGLQMGELKQTKTVHYGSLAWQVDPDLHAQMQITNPLSAQYFARKWGGLPGGQEVYERPFNQSGFDLFIGPEHKARPYGPAFDRYDLGVIKI